MKAAIQRAYDDFHRLTDQNGVGDKIDWTSAAALELLAPPCMKPCLGFPDCFRLTSA